VGAARVAELAYQLGVRESKLDPVPSLALGTSPVTLREMVSAYGTLANNGRYVGEPQLVLRIEDRHGKLLQEFVPPKPVQAMQRAQSLQLVNVMRGVIDEGTGTAIRSRYGIGADVAGKTGTTQDNSDGWFIMMHPQLVAGAWVGYNDNRATMGESWGQGARSALPMVGEFFAQSLRLRAIDARAEFDIPRPRPKPRPQEREADPVHDMVQDILGRLLKMIQ
jgi:penicillin-binding protein 1A